jgi:hypothetical protein
MAKGKRNAGSARVPQARARGARLPQVFSAARAWGGITVKGDVCRWALPLRESAVEIMGDAKRVVPVVIVRDAEDARRHGGK